MSEESNGDWTPVLVLKHMTAILAANDTRYREKFEGQEKAVNAALAAAEKAVNVAEAHAEKWRANANEWRSAMTDRENRFVTQAEYALLKERMDKHEGSSRGMRDLWGWIAAGVMTLVALVGVFLRGK